MTKGDVLDINRANKDATIHGDIKDLSMIADDTYDCLILTQVLQYVDDLDRARGRGRYEHPSTGFPSRVE